VPPRWRLRSAGRIASNGLYMGVVILVVFWLATFVVTRGMSATAGISNIGSSWGRSSRRRA
jgi:hypothetical protein